MAKACDLQARLTQKRERLEKQLTAISLAMARSQLAQARSQASIEALDATMEIVNSQLNPGAGGTVTAWAGKYGARGGLGAFVEQVLAAAAPEPVTTTVLINLASMQFSVALTLPRDRRSFRKSVSSALTSLLKRGLIEPLHSRQEGSHGLWRWTEAGPTFSTMRAASEAVAATADR